MLTRKQPGKFRFVAMCFFHRAIRRFGVLAILLFLFSSPLLLTCPAKEKQASKVRTLAKGLTVQVPENVTIHGKIGFEDFDLYTFKRGTNIVLNAYLGNQPNFPFDKGHGIKKASINGIAIESIESKGKDGLRSREVLFHLSGSQGWPQLLHCWYSNLSSSEAQGIDNVLSTVRLTHPAGRSESKPTAKQDKTLQLVKSLGWVEEKHFDQDVAKLQQLAATPRKSVEMLVQELEPVAILRLDDDPNDPNENARAHHIMWCFRAIYYITGHENVATSSYKLTDSEIDQNRSGLAVKDDGRWAFFTEWMSRRSVYFGPSDAQKKIIDGWKKWVKQNGATWHYQKDAELNDWYFGGPEDNYKGAHTSTAN